MLVRTRTLFCLALSYLIFYFILFLTGSPSAYVIAREWGLYVDSVTHDRAGGTVPPTDFGVNMCVWEIFGVCMYTMCVGV